MANRARDGGCLEKRAVRVGDVCVIGDVTPPPVERQRSWYAGLLPDGRCLAP